MAATATIAHLEGVFPEWLGLLDLGRLADLPASALEPFRHGRPADVVAVVLGGPGLFAEGPALGNIFGALERAGLRARGRPARGDLRSWAMQGVLLLGAPARGGRAEEAWEGLTAGLVGRLCAARAGPEGPPPVFLLWGEAAEKKFAGAVAGHGCAVAAGPDPASAEFLGRGDHFELVNSALAAGGRPPVGWDNARGCLAFSDGAAADNGRPAARASFAAVVVGAHFGGAGFGGAGFGETSVRGGVASAEYALVDEARPGRGVRPVEGSRGPPPSNNRGELLGVVYCLLILLRGGAVGRVEVVSDSKITVKTLTEWLPARLAAGTESALKNLDLVMVAWKLLCALRAQAETVVLTHTHSHRPRPPGDAPRRTQLLWRGNHEADRLAALALPARGSEPGIVVVSPLPALQQLDPPRAEHTRPV